MIRKYLHSRNGMITIRALLSAAIFYGAGFLWGDSPFVSVLCLILGIALLIVQFTVVYYKGAQDFGDEILEHYND